jgi:hypothetical protein
LARDRAHAEQKNGPGQSRARSFEVLEDPLPGLTEGDRKGGPTVFRVPFVDARANRKELRVFTHAALGDDVGRNATRHHRFPNHRGAALGEPEVSVWPTTSTARRLQFRAAATAASMSRIAVGVRFDRSHSKYTT